MFIVCRCVHVRVVTRENEGEMRARESEHPYTPTHKGMLVIEGAAVHSGCPKFHSVRVYRTDAMKYGQTRHHRRRQNCLASWARTCTHRRQTLLREEEGEELGCETVRHRGYIYFCLTGRDLV